jgi:hypothetical protein
MNISFGGRFIKTSSRVSRLFINAHSTCQHSESR